MRLHLHFITTSSFDMEECAQRLVCYLNSCWGEVAQSDSYPKDSTSRNALGPLSKK
ncbi:hypothetical protein BT69DRAFT_1283886 [Atractiella rhizophila]|nr:hypothetical protein BT69DRAFT_1283886 [Atractiella rhizophila]